MRRFLLLVAMWLMAASVLASGPRGVRERAESSMLVTGSIQVDANGQVTGFGIDKEDQLPPGVAGLVRKSVPGWRFEPALHNGSPVAESSRMSLLIVASRLSEDALSVEIRSAHFGRTWRGEDAANKEFKLEPPPYPEPAARVGARGIVYLLVKVRPDGSVMDAIAEQVNLGFATDDATMHQWRGVFASSAVRHAKERWRFAPITAEEKGTDEFLVVRVPIVYSMQGDKPAAYGHWQTYVPGPRQKAPWDRNQNQAAFAPDALPAGGIYRAGSDLHLLTGLSGS
jgi:hypothetical protein